MKTWLRCALIGVVLTIAPWTPAQVATPKLRVLFLGNSLTEGNNVPGLVQAMARLQGVQLDSTMVAPGGYAIEDHWSDGDQLLLRNGAYDVVVLQQGPSTLPESQANLRQWAVTWADEARRQGTHPALYMVWPVRTQTNGFALVSQSYRNAALAADAAIFPAGEAWQKIIRADASIKLYSSDDLHATPTGSFLAAMVIARGLVGLEPARVPATVNGITISATALTRFQAVIAELPAENFAAGVAAEPLPPLPPSTPPSSGSGSTSSPPASAGGGSGGGGVPSGGFLAALLALCAVRLKRRPCCS